MSTITDYDECVTAKRNDADDDEPRGPGQPAKLPQPTDTLSFRASAEVVEYLKSQDDSPGVFIDELIRATADFKKWAKRESKRR